MQMGSMQRKLRENTAVKPGGTLATDHHAGCRSRAVDSYLTQEPADAQLRRPSPSTCTHITGHPPTKHHRTKGLLSYQTKIHLPLTFHISILWCLELEKLNSHPHP